MTLTRPRSRPSRAAGDRPTVAPFVVVAAILLLGVNLRGPIVAVSPVLDTISADLGISATTAGLLTGLPVLCFGLATPAASAVLARFGLGRGVSISLVVSGDGRALHRRSSDPRWPRAMRWRPARAQRSVGQGYAQASY